ncbi:MAG: SDR family oxidoreductase [Rickettsiales bacterium]
MLEKSLFIFGLGYASQAVAHAAMAQGFSVAGTCHSQEKCAALKEQGIKAFLFSEITSEIIAGYNYILSSIPPQENVDVVLPVIRHPSSAIWLGYFSTTGVYGDYAGAWVDESSEPRPNNDRLRKRLEAEEKWRALGGHIFRLAGIYGKGRSALDDVLAGTARRVDKKGQVFSRTHVDDIAQTVLASMLKPNAGAIYNVCDDEPAPAHEVVAFACELLGKEIPPLIPFADAEFSAMGREFYSANRRVKNERIKQELGVKLFYPTYRDGLRNLRKKDIAAFEEGFIKS